MLIRLLACLLLFVGLRIDAFAADHVKASLVSDVASVKPGQPFTVALRLQHEEHWHTYWVYPGTGYATSLAWKLPAGWTASGFRWPTPHVLRDHTGTIVGNGYEGDTLLPLTITPPPDAKVGDTVTLQAKADWLMCSDVCMPGHAPVQITLPVTNDEPQPGATWHSRIADAPLPTDPVNWDVRASRSGKEVVLRLEAKSPAAGKLTAPHFFSEDGYIQFDQPQKIEAKDNIYTFTLPIAEGADTNEARLIGVVSSEEPFRGLRIDVPWTTATLSGPAQKTSGLAGVLVLAFVGGLILNLMPCVFPVLGIKILGFVNQAGADRRKVTLHGIVFTVGVLTSFWVLAGVLAILRAGGDQLGWGFQLQSPLFVFLLAVALLIFALSMSGLFEIGLRATAVGGSLQSKSGLAGSFFTGVLATVVATPCSAPFLAPALGAALAAPVSESFVVFTAIAIGLSVPYLLLSIFPDAVKFLPRPGAWMETFKQVMAFPLYATVAFLIWVLAGQLSESGLLNALFGLTLVAMAGWMYGRFTAPGAKPARVRVGIFGGLILLLLGTALGWPRAPKSDDIVWQPWSHEAVAELQAQNRTIYIDFTARWCATCQANKKLVFGSDEVKREFQEKHIATLKGDWTSHDEKITAELAKWNRSAVPFNLVYKPGSPDPVILPELLTPAIVLNAVK